MATRNPLVLVNGRISELPIGDSVVGVTSEEDTMYSKRVDFVTDNLLYKGEAVVGASESASVWRIRKIVIDTDGDVTETWASGTALFDKAWSDRLTLTYT